MRRLAPIVLIAFVAAGCTTGGTSGSPAGASSTGAKAPAASPTPEPTPTAEQKAAGRKSAETIAALAGKPLPPRARRSRARPPEFVVDEKTGVRLERIPKSSSLYVKDGQVHHRFALSGYGIPIVREDASAYYVEAQAEAKKEVTRRRPRIRRVSGSSSSSGLRGGGRRTAGLQEANPPRGTIRRAADERLLAFEHRHRRPRRRREARDRHAPAAARRAEDRRIFRHEGGWRRSGRRCDVRGAPASATAGWPSADMDGDGKPDIVSIGHGSGLTDLSSTRGHSSSGRRPGACPGGMSARALALGDLTGTAGSTSWRSLGRAGVRRGARREKEREKESEAAGQRPATAADVDSAQYVKGVDIRYFLAQADGTYQSSTTRGSMNPATATRSPSRRNPSTARRLFFASVCRYSGRTQVVYSSTGTRRPPASCGPPRRSSSGTAITSARLSAPTRGSPAAYVTYVKTAPQGAVRRLSPARGCRSTTGTATTGSGSGS